jgi:hypothetical protein
VRDRLLAGRSASARARGQHVVGPAGFVAGSAMLVVLVVAGQYGLARIDDRYGVRSPGQVLFWFAVVLLIVVFKRAYGAGELTRHARRHWWRAIDPDAQEWPWAESGGAILVRRAWQMQAAGFPVTAGTIEWAGDAFTGMTGVPAGSGAFVVVHLAEPAPPMAMHVPFERIGDSPLLELPAVRWNFLRGAIPPWTAHGRALFTVEPSEDGITPAAIEKAVSRALHLTSLLGLDRGRPPDPAGQKRTGERRVVRATRWRAKASGIVRSAAVIYLLLAVCQLIAIGLYAARDSEHRGLLGGLLCSAMVVLVFGGAVCRSPPAASRGGVGLSGTPPTSGTVKGPSSWSGCRRRFRRRRCACRAGSSASRRTRRSCGRRSSGVTSRPGPSAGGSCSSCGP